MFITAIIPKELKLLARVGLGLSHLCEIKLCMVFKTLLIQFTIVDGDIKTSSHFLFNCLNYLKERITLLNSAKYIYPNILDMNNSQPNEILSYGKVNLIK